MSESSAEPRSGRGLAPLQQALFLGSFGLSMLGFLLPIYGRRLGATAIEIGGLFSVFSLMALLFRPVTGWAMDRIGRKPFLVGGLSAYALAMALFAFADQVFLLYAARLVQGLGASLLWISAYTIATESSTVEHRGATTGRIDAKMAQGSLYGVLIGFVILSKYPMRSGWPLLFGLYALLAAAGAWKAWTEAPETLRPGPDRAQREHLWVMLRRLAPLMSVVFLTGISSAMTAPLVLVYLQDRFTHDLGLLALTYLPAAVIYSYLPSRLGRLSDRWGRAPLIALGMAGSGLVLFLLPQLPRFEWLILLWAAEALGLVAASPAQEALVADLTGESSRGTGFGLYQWAASLGAIFGPLLGGWLYDARGQAVPFYLAGLLLFLGSGLMLAWFGRRPTYQPRSVGAEELQ